MPTLSMESTKKMVSKRFLRRLYERNTVAKSKDATELFPSKNPSEPPFFSYDTKHAIGECEERSFFQRKNVFFLVCICKQMQYTYRSRPPKFNRPWGIPNDLPKMILFIWPHGLKAASSVFPSSFVSASVNAPVAT